MSETARLSQRLRAIEASRPEAGWGAEVHMAGSAAERLAAARLVASMYRGEGYLQHEHEYAPFLALHHLLDETAVFVAYGPDECVRGTVAVVFDSPAGLPMEDLYADEIGALRRGKRRLCEFCSLAVDPREGRSPHLMLALFRAAYRYATYVRHADDVCVTLKPSHGPFYGRQLLFQDLGGYREDPRFAAAPTLAMRLVRETVAGKWASGEMNTRRCRMAAFCSEPLAPEERSELLGREFERPRSREEILAALRQRPAVLREAPVAARAYLAQTLRRKETPVRVCLAG